MKRKYSLISLICLVFIIAGYLVMFVAHFLQAQCRLCTRYHYLVAKGKKTNVVKTAIAREIAGFSRAIAHVLPKAA